MGYNGRFEDRLYAQKLRKQGFSYGEILQKISVSKDTLSRWCKDITLSDNQKERLIKNKQLGQKRGSLIAAENKRVIRFEKISKAKEDALIEIGSLSTRDEFIAGISLYAAEGDKTDRHGGFANADAFIMQFMMHWFLYIAKIPLSKIRGVIYIHEELNENNAKKYWADITGIPPSQFRKSYIVKKKKAGYRKHLHEHGILSIRFSDSIIHRKIMGWIYALFSDRIISRSKLEALSG